MLIPLTNESDVYIGVDPSVNNMGVAVYDVTNDLLVIDVVNLEAYYKLFLPYYFLRKEDKWTGRAIVEFPEDFRLHNKKYSSKANQAKFANLADYAVNNIMYSVGMNKGIATSVNALFNQLGIKSAVKENKSTKAQREDNCKLVLKKWTTETYDKKGKSMGIGLGLPFALKMPDHAYDALHNIVYDIDSIGVFKQRKTPSYKRNLTIYTKFTPELEQHFFGTI